MALADWQGDAEREVLERILALLIALAGLADRAALLPAPAQLPVLAILGRGESAARSFVRESVFGAPARAEGAATPAAGDAGRLAAGYRALALALAAMLATGRRPAKATDGEAGALDVFLPVPPREGAAPGAHPAPDTS